MASNELVAVLHFFALCSCFFGIYYVHLNCSPVLCMVYTGSWFLTSGMANFAGFLSILFSYTDSDPNKARSHYALQYHYLFAWISCIVGYPAFVSSTWMAYYPSVAAHVYVAMAVIPLIAWLQRQGDLIIFTTQFVTTFAILSHMYISFLAENTWCLAGACVMLLNLILVSTPTRYAILGFSAREAFLVSSTVTSYLLAHGVELMSVAHKEVKSLRIWWHRFDL